MTYLLLFFAELLVLFFLSRTVTRNLSLLFYKLTRSQKVTIYLMALFFFPGTLVHELAHYLTAAILFVKVGGMEFVPKMMEGGVKMGSVQIGSSDPFRRALIGMAPFFVGTSLTLILLYLFQTYGGLTNFALTILTGYVLFEVSNTMFSSRKDMEGTLELFLVLIVLGAILYLLGARLPAVSPDAVLSSQTVSLFQTGTYFLAIPLVIDFCFVTVLKLIHRL